MIITFFNLNCKLIEGPIPYFFYIYTVDFYNKTRTTQRSGLFLFDQQYYYLTFSQYINTRREQTMQEMTLKRNQEGELVMVYADTLETQYERILRLRKEYE